MTYTKLGEAIFGIDPNWLDKDYEMFLGKLNKEYANLIRDHYVNGRSIDEIANESKVEDITINMIIDIALNQLKQKIDEY